jgi:hypothetical protein
MRLPPWFLHGLFGVGSNLTAARYAKWLFPRRRVPKTKTDLALIHGRSRPMMLSSGHPLFRVFTYLHIHVLGRVL